MTRAAPAERDIARRRLRNQFLLTTSFRDPVDVVRALGAVQAQDYPHARWAVARRARGVTDAEVARAVDSGAIVRTHVLRPTWHLVAREDARWMLALTAPRVAQAMDYYRRTHALDRAIQSRCNVVFERVLRDGASFTRIEMAEALRKAGIEATPARMLHILMHAELDMVICNGPRRGAQPTYALFEERVPASRAFDRDESLAELARRYFTTRGPATVADFAWWSGLTVADAKRGAEAAAPSVRSQIIDGRTYFGGRESHRASSAPTAQLLPNYDEYFIGYRDRSAIAERLRAAKRRTLVNGLIGHSVFVNGQLVARWRRVRGKGAPLALDPLVPLTRAERKLVDAEIARFAAFVGTS